MEQKARGVLPLLLLPLVCAKGRLGWEEADQSANDNCAYQTGVLVCGRVDCAAVGVRDGREVLLPWAQRWRHLPHIGLGLAGLYSASLLYWVRLLEASS